MAKKPERKLNTLNPQEEILSDMFAQEYEAREQAINNHNANPHRSTHITPFGNQVKAKFKDGKTFGFSSTNCPETFLKLGKCVYDVTQDPHCDSCLRCKQPLRS